MTGVCCAVLYLCRAEAQGGFDPSSVGMSEKEAANIALAFGQVSLATDSWRVRSGRSSATLAQRGCRSIDADDATTNASLIQPIGHVRSWLCCSCNVCSYNVSAESAVQVMITTRCGSLIIFMACCAVLCCVCCSMTWMTTGDWIQTSLSRCCSHWARMSAGMRQMRRWR